MGEDVAGPGSLTGPGAPGARGPASQVATRRRQIVGALFAIGYVLTILAANYAITHWGRAPAFPGGPYTVLVWRGIDAPQGCCSPALPSP